MKQPDRYSGQKRHLPRLHTAFVGRGQEITKITSLLSDPSCYLLTLVGVGGIGKTRLALEAAAHMEPHLPDGVYFVPLQAVPSPELLPSAILEVLDVTLTSQDDPQRQLLKYLQDKTLLLILDNVEQFLTPAPANSKGGNSPEELNGLAGLLLNILQRAPAVKLLVTSRGVLNLQEEWLYPVEGLAVPANAQVENWANYDAVKLFVERARRVRRDFSVELEAEGVVQVCRLVEGMPLAIELAATWTKTLTCGEVADEIQDNLDFLSTKLRDVPSRHRSMRAVFEHGWRQLTPTERETFMRLSVFQGGFQRPAAEQVAKASLPVLTALVDKSLLRWEPDGRRYQLHELLRQFGQEQLVQAFELAVQTQALHTNYYTTFLGDHFDDLTGTRQAKALAEIGAELGNVRAAWRRAVSQHDCTGLAYAAMGLHTFYQYRGHFQEGLETFTAAVGAVEVMASSPERDRALAVLLNCTGWFQMRFGRIQEATLMQEKALALFEALDILPAPGQGTDPLTALSLLAATRGDYDEAMKLGQQAWQRAAARSDKKNMAFAGYGMAEGALARGNYETALAYAQQTLALTEAAGNRWFMAYVYNQLGQINQAMGNLAAAADYYRASYAIKKELVDPEGMALALSHLGEVALTQNAYRHAEELYHQSLTIYQKLGDRGGLVRVLHGLGVAAGNLGNDSQARDYFQQALQVASEAQIIPLTLAVLVSIGTYLLEKSDASERGVAVLTFVQQHPATDQMLADKVNHLLDRPQGAIRPEMYGLELETLITSLLAELSAPVVRVDGPSGPVSHAGAAPEQPLIDPLSERELEVLRLIAEGLTNRQIAERLTVVLGTVKAHTSNIYGKLGVGNRTQAVARARELKLL